jgi:hypothetical protein
MLSDILEGGRVTDTEISGDFWRVKVACRSVIALYYAAWVLVFATHHASAPPGVSCGNSSMCTFNDRVTEVEFLMTGLAETSSIAEILLCLPSQRLNDHGRSAIGVYLVYEALFGVCTGVLYAILQRPDLVAGYLTLHLIKGAVGGIILDMLRRRLREICDVAGGQRVLFKLAGKYMVEIVKVFTAQIGLMIALIAAFFIEKKRPNHGRLLAATTLSVALTQAYVLVVCVRDAGGLRADAIAKLTFTATELVAVFAILAFSVIGTFAYFLALEDGGQQIVDEAAGRTLYFSAHAVYLLAAGAVGLLMQSAKARQKAKLNKASEMAPTVPQTEHPASMRPPMLENASLEV